MGGSERQMALLARELWARGFYPRFILLARSGELANKLGEGHIQVEVLRFRRLRGAHPREVLSRALRNVGELARFIRLVRRGHYDVIDAWLYHAYVLSALTRPLTRVPVVVSGRRSLSDFKEQFNPILRLVDRLAAHWSDAIVANSHAVARDVARREGLDLASIRVIQNGVERLEVNWDSSRRRARAQWGARPGDVIVGCVANYKAGKGLRTLVRASADVCRAHKNVRLVLVGEGPLRNELEELIATEGMAETILLHGAVEDARELLSGFDVLAQASHSEGLPNAILEAAAAGLAIVATDVGGTREIIEPGISGLIVPVGDQSALAFALTNLIVDPSLRARLGSAAAANAMEFSVDRLAEETAALYRSLVLRS